MYEAFYQLHGKPFQLTPDPGMLFPTHSHQRALSYLLYGLEQGEGFVLITGAVGTGKTLLIQKLLEELAPRDIAIAAIASANLDGGDLLPAVAAAFDLPYEQRSKEGLLHDVKQHLVALRARHTQALLVVDEAQTLSVAALELLRILSNFEINGHALLQVFLVGQTELRRTIASQHMEQLRQRIVASHRLEPLDAAEGRAYILHRLHAVGWQHDPEIAPAVLDAVCRAAGGIPRRINLIMDRLLLHGYLEELHALDAADVRLVLAEIGEEMDGATLAARAEVASRAGTPSATTATPLHAAEYAELTRQRDQLLAEWLRVEARLRDLAATGSAAPGNDPHGAEPMPPRGGGAPP